MRRCRRRVRERLRATGAGGGRGWCGRRVRTRSVGQSRIESLAPSRGISRMQAVAYRRARKLLSSQRDQITARILGVIHSLLIVALLGILALFVALMSSRGEARVPKDRADQLPQWVSGHLLGQEGTFLVYRDTGIFPLIADNFASEYWIRRRGAGLEPLDRGPAGVAEQPGRARHAAGSGIDLPDPDRDPVTVAASGHGARRPRWRRHSGSSSIVRCTGWANRRCRPRESAR